MGEERDHPSKYADFRSDIDGDRYIIIDPGDFDMAGWKVETREVPLNPKGVGWADYIPVDELPEATSRIEQFTRDQTWYGGGPGGGWNGLGFGEPGHPWSASCNHDRRVVRWIPPETGS